MTLRTAGLLASCAAAAFGQNLSVGQGGMNVSDTSKVLAPPRVRVGKELDMAELPLSMAPPQFFLNVGTSGRYGPYALEDGTAVGSKQAPYTLRMFDLGNHFTLQDAAGGTNTVYGPFPSTNGAQVVIGKSVMTVVRVPPKLFVTLNHPGKINQMPLMAIAPYNNVTLIRELYGLRAKYVNLANRVDADTADVEFAGVPRIRSGLSGNTTLSPVIKTSARDKQNAFKGAELSAITFLETLLAQAFKIRSQAITDGATYHFGMPPGEYVFCALQKVKDPAAQGVTGSATAVWWTTFTFDGEHPLSLTLTPENAITWRDIFALNRK